ncbi:hypothetical protein MIMGU_mgv1a014554mg [Erythranthe guttata]|uniref:Uncharacterized protein n=1 Tax=Erythranthe guttata TaxID=4155 RepID=A0A022S347_ERYGU|nr:hypothetical protein MIMGU_mgv1a014554mg [Erythranthe guttata]
MNTLGSVNLEFFSGDWPRIDRSSSMNPESIDRSRSSIDTRKSRRMDRTALQSSKVRRTIRKLVKYTTTVCSAPGIRISSGGAGWDRVRMRVLTLRLRWQIEGFVGDSRLLPGLPPPAGSSSRRRVWTSLKEEQANLGAGALWTRALVLDLLSHIGSEISIEHHRKLVQFTGNFSCKFQLDRIRLII